MNKLKSPLLGYKNAKYPSGHVSQWFGENRALYWQRMGINGHNGIDIVAPWGTPIYAVEGGLVVDVKDSPEGFGKHIRILSPIDNKKGTGREWTYGHASENLVKIGDTVEAGQLVQKMGNTGFVVSGATPFWEYNPYAGTHLHLGVREYSLATAQNGWRYNADTPYIHILNHGNGFLGAFDFKELLDFKEPEEEVIKGMKLTIISLLNQIISILTSRK
jgi:murein DD-endopeptidase MepM/ murein hydrolase activator NlpD